MHSFGKKLSNKAHFLTVCNWSTRKRVETAKFSALLISHHIKCAFLECRSRYTIPSTSSHIFCSKMVAQNWRSLRQQLQMFLTWHQNNSRLDSDLCFTSAIAIAMCAVQSNWKRGIHAMKFCCKAVSINISKWQLYAI